MISGQSAPLWRRVGRVPAAILVAATAASVLVLVANGPLPYGSDTTFHALAVRDFTAALREGIVYPRWVGDANVGFGAPTFVYYAPLGYYLAGLVSLVAPDAVDALKWSMVLGAALTAVSFFLFTRDIATDTAAAVGAAVYLLLPYRMIDLYERCAYGELLAFVWLPVLLWAIRRLSSGFSWGAWFAFALGCAGLVVTHVLTALMAALVIGPYALVVAWRSRRWSLVAHLATASAAALLLTAVYLVPAAVGRDEMNMAFAVGTKFRYWGNYILRDATRLGFELDDIRPWVDGASVATAAVAAVAGWFARRSRAALGLAVVAVWAFVLETPLSAPVWAATPGLGVVQFPWRFATFGVLATATLAAVALSGERRGLAALFMAAAAVPALVMSVAVTHVHEYEFDRELAADPGIARRMLYEYLPANADWSGMWSELDPVQPEAYVDDGVSVETLAWTSERRVVRVTAPEATTVVLRTLAFSGWETRLDGAVVPTKADATYHALEVDVPAGEHEVEARYAVTPARRVGAVASSLGLLLMIALAVVGYLRYRRSVSTGSASDRVARAR